MGEDFHQCKAKWEQTIDQIQLFISSLNFWKDNGKEQVKVIKLFKTVVNFKTIKKFENKNKLDQWPKVLFKSQEAIDSYFEMDCKDLFVIQILEDLSE